MDPRGPEYLGTFIRINSPENLGSLPNMFQFAEAFQREVTPERPIGIFITDDVVIKKVDFSNEVLTLSVGPMVFMINQNEFTYPFEVKVP